MYFYIVAQTELCLITAYPSLAQSQLDFTFNVFGIKLFLDQHVRVFKHLFMPLTIRCRPLLQLHYDPDHQHQAGQVDDQHGVKGMVAELTGRVVRIIWIIFNLTDPCPVRRSVTLTHHKGRPLGGALRVVFAPITFIILLAPFCIFFPLRPALP